MKQPSRKNVLRALDIVVQTDPFLGPRGLTPQFARFRDDAREWLLDERIIGYGFPGKGGFYGSSHQAKAAIYVESDDKAAQLEEIVPSELKIPGVDIPVGIDIVSVGEVSPMAFTTRCRPMHVGASISHNRVQSGTLAAFATCMGANDDSVYALSCNHVLAEFNSLSVGDAVVQPGVTDKGKAKDKIGELAALIPLAYSDEEYLNYADAALAKITEPDCLPDGINALPTVAINRDLRKNSRVHMIGRTSGRSVGQTIDISARLRLRYPRGPRSTSLVGFTDVVVCTPFTKRGDSGALVMDNNNRAVGLIMAGSNRVSIMCKIGYIIDSLNIEKILVPHD
jgi:hypothetical protein